MRKESSFNNRVHKDLLSLTDRTAACCTRTEFLCLLSALRPKFVNSVLKVVTNDVILAQRLLYLHRRQRS